MNNNYTSLKELSNYNLLKLALSIADDVFTRYNHTLETLQLLKQGYDILYYAKNYNEFIISYTDKNIQLGFHLLVDMFHCYLYDKINFYINACETINHFKSLLASKFTEKELV